ncbi:hypothetical protein ACOSQ2_021350 [Xanthoceras sorbifolium]
MKVRCIIPFFLLILYTQSLTGCCFEGFPTLKSQDFNVTKMMNGLYAESVDGEIIDYSRKGQGRKGGSYGGGNMAHRPRSNQKNAATPCFFVSTLPFILLLPFLLSIF